MAGGKKLRLSDVTLITVTAVDVDAANSALLHSMKGIDFAEVKMLSSTLPRIKDKRIRYVEIPPLDLLGYSRFIIEQLARHVATGHCLIIQSDGFVTNPDRWDNRFLDADYIGAPWPEEVSVRNGLIPTLRLDRHRVGNGGFSLRSKKLLSLCAEIDFDRLDFPIKSEDLIICHFLHDQMKARGVVFAKPHLAARFSIEDSRGLYGQRLEWCFGFHGKHWLPHLIATRVLGRR